MNPTFSFRTAKDHHIQVPPSSPFFQMPNVFVIPPEEEIETSPWCCFDAAEASPPTSTQFSTSPDFHSLDLALNLMNKPEAPVPYPSQSHPGDDTVTLKKREKRSRLEYISDSAVEEFQAVSHSGNDSMVVEVIKVRRADTGDAEASATKRSKTFKSRASKAFRSLKNVGRSNKPSAKDIWPSISTGSQITLEEPVQPQTPRPRSSMRSKRSSITLSQIFQPKNRSTFDLASPGTPPPPAESADPYHTPVTTSPSPDDPPGLPMDTNTDISGLRAPSPAPSTAKTTSAKTRFSILDLHRLFSFSSTATSETIPSPPSASSTPSMSREASTASSTSVDTPDTPMDVEDAFQHTPISHTPSCTSSSLRDSAESVKDYGDGEWRSTLVLDEPGRGDVGEMRLDSLHFDSLSFDAEYF